MPRARAIGFGAAAAEVVQGIDLTGKPAAIAISGYSGIGVERGWEKYGSAGLLLSSADRGWSGQRSRNHRAPDGSDGVHAGRTDGTRRSVLTHPGFYPSSF